MIVWLQYASCTLPWHTIPCPAKVTLALKGLRMPLGSKAALMRRIAATTAGGLLYPMQAACEQANQEA